MGEVVESLGAVCIPALLLVLGANLGRGPGVAAGRLPAAAVVAAVVTRLLAVPLVCGALLWGAWSAGEWRAGLVGWIWVVNCGSHHTITLMRRAGAIRRCESVR